ncbi:hypothetical protein GH714_019495 [Hevea brasiliensis]|uniref:Uncharacterized protein n=1 Tax=Hevea brasiliensis TaxID=3981 RepID=A0A6A6L9T8_HEVBR|nr:hypothetical protein GH714_019495 [Hevea brasiliensis]
MEVEQQKAIQSLEKEQGPCVYTKVLGARINLLLSCEQSYEGSEDPIERLKEIPIATATSSENRFFQDVEDPLRALPGAEFEQQPFPRPGGQGSEFLRGFRSADQNENGLADAWDEIQRSHVHPPPQANIPQLDHVYNRGPQLQPTLDVSVIRKRLGARLGAQTRRNPGTSPGKPPGEVASTRCCLGAQARFRELEDYWNESQGSLRPGPHAADGWIAEFNQHRLDRSDPDAWAHAFERSTVLMVGPQNLSRYLHLALIFKLADRLHSLEQQLASMDQMRGVNVPNLAAMEQTRMLAHTLSQNNDPKFQNSKFLQFVSKMSRGELIIDDNQVKPAAGPSDWATEYQQQYTRGTSWADEYVRDEVSRGPDRWVNEFTTEAEQNGSVDDRWVNEFSKLHVNDWVEEFGQQVEKGELGDSSADNWANAYDESFRGDYVFSGMNPYVGHPNPLKEGQELFRKGLLSEAVLALEAEVLKNPDNAEGWRLLGIAHAENDDDQQAIAAMMRAQEADPMNLEVLLALGVSHTNELEQAAALKYLYGWLRNHPKYGTLATPELADSLYYADVARLFNEASQISPEDADVHIVLGVLYNLSREYDKAIASFQTALKLKPQDYSLWNKLGATQANSVQSADAILAYQHALDLKPNYVRAWANMGISYANQGMYEESIRYYVRALAMNPKADNAWQYLRISLSCASRNDMLEVCDSRNIDLLQKEFPL